MDANASSVTHRNRRGDGYTYDYDCGDIASAHGYYDSHGNPYAYSITVTYTDAGTDAADTTIRRTHLVRRFIGQ